MKKADTGRAKHLHRYFHIYVKNIDQHKKRDQAEETLEALNRIIKDNNGLKTWALGMSVKYKAMLERAKERKSAQYYRTVVYNDIIEILPQSSLTAQNAQHYWMTTERIFSSSIGRSLMSNRT